MSYYEQLSLIYVEKNAQPGDTPEKLITMFNEAYEEITKYEAERKKQARMGNNSSK